MRRTSSWALVLALQVVHAQRFPVPDLVQDFTSFNPNYLAELANLTTALTAAFTTFEVLAATHPNAHTSCITNRMNECELQIVQTANFTLGWIIMQEVQAQLATPPETWPADDAQSPVDGGWGQCYHGLYLRIEATYDAIMNLMDQGLTPAIPVTLFDQLNSPQQLLDHLRDLVDVDIAETGANTVIAANTINSNILRLVHKQLPSNYVWHTGLWDALYDYTFQEWRDPASGAWGPWYVRPNGSKYSVPDLSTTFHIAKYYGQDFGYSLGLLSELGNTVVDLVEVPFPWGQLTAQGIPFTHNLYDTAQLFMQSWPAATPSVRAAMAAQSYRWLNFTMSILDEEDGGWPKTAYDDTYETAQYFGVGTLSLFGFFNASACFWSEYAESADACRLGRSYEERRVIYDKLAHNMFKKLANNGGSGSDYYDTLEKLGLVIPLSMRSDFNGSAPPMLPPSPPVRPPFAASDFGAGVGVGIVVACGVIGFAAALQGMLRTRSRHEQQLMPKVEGSEGLVEAEESITPATTDAKGDRSAESAVPAVAEPM